MKHLLFAMYQEAWDVLLRTFPPGGFPDDPPANPFFLDIPSGYEEADCKVMVFGKETNCWGGGEFPREGGVTGLLHVYREFFVFFIFSRSEATNFS